MTRYTALPAAQNGRAGRHAMGVLILTTGGTIDKVYFDALSAYQIGPPAASQILSVARMFIPITFREVLRKDSLDLTGEDRATMRAAIIASGHARIVITHGTDTMIDTAEALSGIEGKTIVLVGAMAPAGFRDSDAPVNLGLALAAAQLAEPGVYIAMSGTIFDPKHAHKNRETGRFEYRTMI